MDKIFNFFIQLLVKIFQWHLMSIKEDS